MLISELFKRREECMSAASRPAPGESHATTGGDSEVRSMHGIAAPSITEANSGA